MKLKFTNVLLAAAIAFGAAVGFSSCKDTDNDMFVGVESQYDALKKKVDAIQTSLDEYAKKVDVAAADKVLQDQIDALKGDVSDLKGDVSDLKGDVSDILNDISDIKGDIQDLQDAIDDINDVLDTLDDTYVDWDTYNAKMAEIDGRLDDLEEAVELLGKRVDDLEKEVNDIKTYLKNIDMRVSSIQLQGARNMAFPMINTPLNARSLALFNYYGKVTDPSKNHLGVTGEIWGRQQVGALGTLYFSASPLDLDLTDDAYTVTLVNSQGAEAAVKPLEVAASDELLLMGGSRADQLLWEAAVTATSGDALALNFSDAKEEVINIIKSLRNKNIGSIGLLPEVLKAAFVDNKSMPAYALKISWEEVDTVTGATVTRSAISDFGVMVNTFTPLSFNTLKDEHGPELPTLPDVEALKNKFNTTVDEIAGKITIDFSNASLTIDYSNVNLVVYDNNGVKVGEVDADDIIDLVNQIEAGIPGLTKEMADQVNDQIKEVVDTLKTKASNAIDKFSNIYELLTKVYNKISDAIYTPNLVLQPVAFIGSTEDGELHRMSEYPTLPTQVENTAFQIFATSWTAEFIAPAYLKQITVNDEALGVVDGAEQFFDVTLKPGLNTIVYSAVDYHGFQVDKTYYVEVAE